jgi:uncharacterized circularly permuted ATP-grasp superfamily protein
MSEPEADLQLPDDTTSVDTAPSAPPFVESDKVLYTRSFTELFAALSERIVEHTAPQLPEALQQPARQHPALTLALIVGFTLFLALGAH